MNLNITIPKKFQRALEVHKRFKIFFGGRGSGKSMTIADIMLMKAHTQGIKIACLREYQNSLADSCHALMKSEITRIGIPHFSVTDKHIRHVNGAEIVFRGLARSGDSIKSMSGIGAFFCEESQSISEQSLRYLTPTLREANAELWMALNPQSSSDPIAKRFINPFKSYLDRFGYYEDDLHLIVKVNHVDNPWFPDALRQEMEFDREHRSRAEFDHIWMGAFNDEVENSIILAEWFDSAVDAHIKLGYKPLGKKICAFDPADSGDAKAYGVRHGSVVLDVREKHDGDVADGTDWALDLAINEKVDMFIWDSGGLGLSLKRQIDQGLQDHFIEWIMFNGAEKPVNPAQIAEEQTDGKRARTNADLYYNKRAQYYKRLAQKFFNTYMAVEKGVYCDPDDMISLSSNIESMEALRSEVCRIPSKPNASGKFQIMSKPDMKSKGIESPNMSDVLMMLQEIPVTRKTYKPQSQVDWRAM